MTIKILGSGCRNCITLQENTRKALESLGQEAEIIKVTNFEEMAKYGIMSTPGLVIDEKLVSSGKVLKPSEIEKLIIKSENGENTNNQKDCSCKGKCEIISKSPNKGF